jgi:hypothetical protein
MGAPVCGGGISNGCASDPFGFILQRKIVVAGRSATAANWRILHSKTQGVHFEPPFRSCIAGPVA